MIQAQRFITRKKHHPHQGKAGGEHHQHIRQRAQRPCQHRRVQAGRKHQSQRHRRQESLRLTGRFKKQFHFLRHFQAKARLAAVLGDS